LKARKASYQRAGVPRAGDPAWNAPVPPLYYRVFRTLERRVRDQKYGHGERLPSEDDLCREFGASRITIRQAVGRLVDLGFVTRRRGSGTFVEFRQEQRPPETVKFTAALEDLFAQVETVSTKSAQITEEKPPPDVRAVLGLDAAATVLVVRRVRAFRDQVFSLTTNYLPSHLRTRLSESDLYRYPLLQLLEQQLRIDFRQADQVIEARLADEDVARVLGIRFGDPVLFVERHMFVDAARPFEVVRSYYRADLYRYRIRLTRGQKAPFRWRVSDGERKSSAIHHSSRGGKER
jgi:GntR family transcriptional regulator